MSYSSATHVINEDLFRDALVRERRRADRSNEPLLLFLVSVEHDPSISSGVIAALSAAKRETDVLGWFSDRSTLGVIVPEISSKDVTVIRSIEARLKTELTRRLNSAALTGLAVDVHVHTPFKHDEDFKLVDRLIPRPETPAAAASIKRAVDVAGSLSLLTLLSPLLLVVAAAVKATSKGPVFYRQERVGQMQKRFGMFKFRTMRTDADHRAHHEFVTKFIKASGDLGKGGNGAAPFKIKNDPRVTRVGRLLRKSSIDELPQLWNVLRGDMSLVGPRPPLPYEVEQYQPWHCRRVLEAKPGITGLWQVKGRSRTTFDEMVRLDLQYAKSCSLWTDLKILFATPGAVISGKGAA